MAPQQDSRKSKKTINRTPASCTACRRRKTGCDRLWPCSECEKHKLDCDYEGARPPSLISTRRRFANISECEEYIKQLEVRLKALEEAKPEAQPALAESTSAAQTPIDFADDDLACHLSRVTLGPRVRSLQPRALEIKAQALLAKLPQPPVSAVFLPQPAFNMSLIPTGPPTPLSEVQASLPPRHELEQLAGHFFGNLNIWSHAIEPRSWPETLENCYQSREAAKLSTLDIHQLAAVLGVAGHGLSFRASVHQSDPDSKFQDLARAHRYFTLALASLTHPDQGAILTRPSVWGIRAMALLTNAELSPEDLDHGVFLWNLTATLAGSIGLFQEPPGLDATEVDEVELESRRNLAWSAMANDWTGSAIMGAMRQPINLNYYAVQIPGTVGCEVDPIDGWPLDPVIAMRRAFALSDRVLFSTIMFSERSVSYDRFLEVEQMMEDVERMLPERLQIVFNSDGPTLHPKFPLDPYRTILFYAVWHRLMCSRIRVHRPFIFLKQGVSDTERSRHVSELERSCRMHFLMHNFLPRNYLMNPLVMFIYVNTCVACALGLVACPNVFDADFFLPQLRKLVEFMGDCSEGTIASSLARRGATLLKMLMAQAEQLANVSQSAPKRLHGSTSSPRLNLETSHSDALKHKSTKPLSVPGSEILPQTNASSSHESPETEKRQVVPLKTLPAASLPLQHKAHANLATLVRPPEEALSLAGTPSPPLQTLIDWNSMGGLSFTFRSPSLPPSDPSSSSTNWDWFKSSEAIDPELFSLSGIPTL